MFNYSLMLCCRVVGWDHSHPTFQALPSIIDVENQLRQQVTAQLIPFILYLLPFSFPLIIPSSCPHAFSVIQPACQCTNRHAHIGFVSTCSRLLVTEICPFADGASKAFRCGATHSSHCETVGPPQRGGSQPNDMVFSQVSCESSPSRYGSKLLASNFTSAQAVVGSQILTPVSVI